VFALTLDHTDDLTLVALVLGVGFVIAAVARRSSRASCAT
jgi:hypothetical protein